MHRHHFQITIGTKILGIAVSLLLLMALLAYHTRFRINRVAAEVDDLEQFIIPITNLVDEVSVNALEQEVYLERILKFYAYDPPEVVAVEKEKALFERRNRQVNHDLDRAVALARKAMISARTENERQEMAVVEPLLEKIKIEHRDIYEHGRELFSLLAENRSGAEIHQKELRIEAEEDHLNQEIETILQELGAFMVAIAGLSERHHQSVIYSGVIITIAAVILGLIFATVVASGLTRPLRDLSQRVQGLQAGHAGDIARIEVQSGDEVGQLTRTFNHMIGELAEKEQLKDIFGRYIDPRLVEHLADSGQSLPTSGRKQTVSVLMSDLMGFSKIMAELEPEQVVELINRYLELLARPINDRRGFVEIVTTEIKGFWAEPFVEPKTHARLAAEAALAQSAALSAYKEQLVSLLKGASPAALKAVNELGIAIGVTTGPLILANMGPEWSQVYTVMGDMVNTAARLKGAAEQFGTPVLMLHETYDRLDGSMAARELGLIQVVGKAEKLRVYELVGPHDALSSTDEALIENFRQGLDAFRLRRWQAAETAFTACLQATPQDIPAKRYLRQIRELRGRQLPSEWDGVWQLKHKGGSVSSSHATHAEAGLKTKPAAGAAP